jgi:hypothetical protein
MRAIKAACAPGRYDSRAAVAPRLPAPTCAAPVAASPAHPAHPTPLAQTSARDIGADEAKRVLASFSPPPAAQPLAASPAPLSWASEYDLGAAGARRLLAMCGGGGVSESLGGAATSTKGLDVEFDKGAAEARQIFALAGQFNGKGARIDAEQQAGAEWARKLLGK